MDSELLSYEEAAEFLGLRVGTLYSMVSRRQIPHLRLGRRLVRFSRAGLKAWVEACSVAPVVEVGRAGV